MRRGCGERVNVQRRGILCMHHTVGQLVLKWLRQQSGVRRLARMVRVDILAFVLTCRRRRVARHGAHAVLETLAVDIGELGFVGWQLVFLSTILSRMDAGSLTRHLLVAFRPDTLRGGEKEIGQEERHDCGDGDPDAVAGAPGPG